MPSPYDFFTEGLTVVQDFPSSVHNKTFLITGPSPGSLGAETALSLAHGKPATIILVGRSLEKAQPVIDSIRSLSPEAYMPFVTVDLSSLSSVRAGTRTILQDPKIEHIDVLINNAGIMACPYSKTVDGFESQFATDHLSHFLLTNLLMPLLLSSPSPRVINLSSFAHAVSNVRFEDPGFENGEKYTIWEGYGQAKTANILFTVELNRRLGGKGLKSLALHPGAVDSGLQKYLTEEIWKDAHAMAKKIGAGIPVRKNLQQGCSTTLRAALDPELKADGDSCYLWDCQIVKPDGGKKLMAYAVDPEGAKKCWALSEEMVGEVFEY
jgi:NAD(P)-dependent dehydrogenase (short-subunit alcohol dehydrogenase family)